MLIKRKLAQGEIFLALILWGAGLTGAALGCPFALQWLYFFAWYPLILFLDGVLYGLRGDSWLLDRPRDLLKMAFWSVSVWLVFEALNLVLKNWGYAGVIANPWVRWPGQALAFATVLPGVLLGAEVLAALGIFRGRRGRPLTLPLAWEPAALLLGTACLVLPLVWPRYYFPLVWGAGFFLLDPFVKLLGGRSLIQAWLDGRAPGTPLPAHRRAALRPLVGGLELWRHGQMGLHPAGAGLRQDLRDAGPGLPGVSPLCPGVRGHV